MAGVEQTIHEVTPREQVGARTGELYEYQYHQAAAEALSLINDADTLCVYCEWHDDYVTERSPGYVFFQVKTRTKSKGPWPFTELFGLGKKPKGKPRPVINKNSIFAHLWDHTQKFGPRCTQFIFVSDAGIDAQLEDILDQTKKVADPGALPPKVRETFKQLRQSLEPEFPKCYGRFAVCIPVSAPCPRRCRQCEKPAGVPDDNRNAYSRRF